MKMTKPISRGKEQREYIDHYPSEEKDSYVSGACTCSGCLVGLGHYKGYWRNIKMKNLRQRIEEILKLGNYTRAEAVDKLEALIHQEKIMAIGEFANKHRVAIEDIDLDNQAGEE